MTERRHVLVVGCGRSGTNHTSLLLRRAGLDVGHEWVGSHGCVSWYFASDEPAPAVVYDRQPKKRHMGGTERRGDFEFAHVLHQVRHPLLVMPSACSVLTNEDWLFVERAAGIPAALPKPLRVLRYWVEWNMRCAELAELTYRVEDIALRWGELAPRFGAGAFPAGVTTTTNRTTGFKRTARDRFAGHCSWEALARYDAGLVRRARELADAFGYDPDRTEIGKGR